MYNNICNLSISGTNFDCCLIWKTKTWKQMQIVQMHGRKELQIRNATQLNIQNMVRDMNYRQEMQHHCLICR